MAETRTPPPAVYFIGVLAADAAMLPRVQQMLEKEWGQICLQSPVYDFSHTAYYAHESGNRIVRTFYGFCQRYDRTELAARKVRTNRMEEELAAALTPDVEAGVTRPVNLDPGYLVPEKIVLASAKNFAHRIYIGEGIFAEVTLLYRNKRFETLPWTFPDFASGKYDGFFKTLRNDLMKNPDATNETESDEGLDEESAGE